MATFFGYNFPFYAETFVLPPQSDERLIKNDILQLLLTSPGERVMRPDFGTGIRKFAFQPLDDNSIRDIKSDIARAIQLFEPRVDFKDVIVNPTPDNNLASITVLVAIKNTPNKVLRVDAQFVSGTATRQSQQLGV